eukprot:TRINITY_DN27074_c0_g1_i3.p1 TRINITY_DN27074_c0_g1~~TRINITY_DN27074_c0_g1_i3.p1  ORF type:complete len:217 (-),score=42.49 TRINITY_DN27074_c0_g1_i3:64-714(-)
MHTPSRATPNRGRNGRTPAKAPSDEEQVNSEFVEAVLRMHLPATHRPFLKIRQCRSISNPQLERDFAVSSEGLTVLDAWFHSFRMDDVDGVCKRGFTAMQGHPMRFGMYLSMPDVPAVDGPVMKLVLCKVAVGKSLMREHASSEEVDKVPRGHHSVYIAHDAGTEHSEASFIDTYTLCDPALAICTHEVEFQISASASRGGKELSLIHISEPTRPY